MKNKPVTNEIYFTSFAFFKTTGGLYKITHPPPIVEYIYPCTELKLTKKSEPFDKHFKTKGHVKVENVYI